MVKYSENHDYELIESAGLFDMRNAQILRAELGEIDRAGKTAAITLLDTCTATLPDLAAVPFWYHCEFASGTLEELEHGHLAFNQGDIVAVLFIPDLNDVPARFYIVDHVDLRGPRSCGSEFLVIKMSGDGSNAAMVFTIFNVGALSVLDLATFANLDELSPAKPASFPASFATHSAWIDYNFLAATPAAVVPATIAALDPPEADTYEDDEVLNYAEYPTVVDPASYLYTDASYQGANQLHSLSQELRWSGFEAWRSSPQYATFATERQQEISSISIDPWGWTVTDGTTSTNTAISLTLEASHTYTVTVDIGGAWSFSNLSSYQLEISGPSMPTLQSAASRSASYAIASTDTAPAPGAVLWDEIYSLSVGSAVFNRHSHCVGAFGFYAFFAAPFAVASQSSLAVDTESTGEWGYEQTSGTWSRRATTTATATIHNNVVAAVTPFSSLEGVDLTVDVSPVICLQSAHPALSAALSSAVSGVMSHVWEDTGDLSTSVIGPTLAAYVKKQA